MALILLAMTGCERAPPDLPADTTSVNHTDSITLADFSKADAALSCDQIADERQQIVATMTNDNSRIESNRTRNEDALYVGGLFGAVGLLAAAPFTDSNDPERSEITNLYQRRDTLIKLAEVKHCPTPAIAK